MEYTTLGNSELKVSKICLGCLSFGEQTDLFKWTLDYPSSEVIIKKALDLGINFFDTANVYCAGSSEEFLGRAIQALTPRSKVIIATKVFFNEGCLSYNGIINSVDASLKRLQMDYIDLLIVHRFDYNTPIEETMKALNDCIKSKKVRYIGASAMYAFQFAKMQECARKNGYAQFISMQNHYNLIYREEEREMMKLLKEEGVSSTPFCALACGRLSRMWDSNSSRFATDVFAQKFYDNDYKDADFLIIKRVKEIADKIGVSQSQVALSWVLNKERVASPILGVTKMEHLVDAVNSWKVKLGKEDIQYLEELYRPHPIVGAIDRGDNALSLEK